MTCSLPSMQMALPSHLCAILFCQIDGNVSVHVPSIYPVLGRLRIIFVSMNRKPDCILKSINSQR